jgi:hypothetical protein
MTIHPLLAPRLRRAHLHIYRLPVPVFAYYGMTFPFTIQYNNTALTEFSSPFFSEDSLPVFNGILIEFVREPSGVGEDMLGTHKIKEIYIKQAQ